MRWCTGAIGKSHQASMNIINIRSVVHQRQKLQGDKITAGIDDSTMMKLQGDKITAGIDDRTMMQ